MKVFISGGCKNGKSSYAQALSLKMQKPETALYYIATMIPGDNEDETRISMHQKDREGMGFVTIEAGRNIDLAVVNYDKSGTFLLDSVTALLANEMFTSDSGFLPDVHLKVTNDLKELITTISNIIIVSDFIFSDAFIYDAMTDYYRRGLAFIDKQVAAMCDVVIEACAGNYIVHKGKAGLEELLYGSF